MDISTGGLYLALLRLHEGASLAAGASSTIDGTGEIFKVADILLQATLD